MSQTCYYHPATSITSTCAQCGIPLCGPCTNVIGAATACKQCAPAVQTRLQNSPAASPFSQPGPQVYPPSGGAQAPPGQYNSPDPRYGPGAFTQTSAGQESRSIGLGLLLGSVIGVTGSILVLKILFYSHFGLSLLYVGVGYGVGYGIWSQTRRGSVGLAMAAVGIMIVSLLIAHLVYAGDVLNQARADGASLTGVTALDVLPLSMKMFSPMHWVCILIGLGACWRGVEHQSS